MCSFKLVQIVFKIQFTISKLHFFKNPGWLRACPVWKLAVGNTKFENWFRWKLKWIILPVYDSFLPSIISIEGWQKIKTTEVYKNYSSIFVSKHMIMIFSLQFSSLQRRKNNTGVLGTKLRTSCKLECNGDQIETVLDQEKLLVDLKWTK